MSSTTSAMPADESLHQAVLARHAATFGADDTPRRAWRLDGAQLPADAVEPDAVLFSDGPAAAAAIEQASAMGAVGIETSREGDCWIDTVRSPMGTWVFSVQADSDAAHGPQFVAVLLACLGLHFPAHDALCLARAWQPGSLDWPDRFARFPQVRQAALVPPGQTVAPFVPCPPDLGLYAVVPTADWIERLVPLGVPTLQLRFKSSDPTAVADQIARSAEAARGSRSRLFINDHWRAALDYHASHGGDSAASGIYGIHLGQEDLDEADLDALRASGLRLGVSTHGYAEMLRVAPLRPSYLALGAIFPTTTKVMPTQPQGLGRFYAYARLMREQVPALVGIGGVDAGNLPQVLAAGVGSAAVVRAITEAADVPAAVERLMAAFEKGGTPGPA
ncbi:thiamine phosphate synthase [Cupriavidus sp. AU9028]|uniref:thiamine phosphate synthase n=1 Tax=Cupriavidus sp. AU9028 TaxID=2871157 RepID=UPI001C94AB8B|nr:thiamine phosphate synthase [Cupriavidus sp. AU9028]MBY4896663.1 thiamine phosphate synthase [Cupriavidus sp. AU9028]